MKSITEQLNLGTYRHNPKHTPRSSDKNLLTEFILMSVTGVEKKNLEAHVELCAERYDALEEKLNGVEEKVESLEVAVNEIKDMISDMNNRHQKQLIKWGVSIIGSLLLLTGWMSVNYVIPGITV